MKKILFFAYTPFQIIASLAIKEQFYKRDSADIVLSDSIQGRDNIRSNILKNDLFSKVYYVNIRDYFPKSNNRLLHELNRLKSAISPYYIGDNILNESPIYDVFVTTEINYITESIYSYIRRKNSKVDVELMDEGYSSYTYYFKEAFKPTKLKNRIKSYYFKLPGRMLGRKFISEKAKTIYYFAPELLCWTNIPYSIKQINIKDNHEFQEKMNLLFDYEMLMSDGIEKEFDRKYLYFEESFFWSMGNSNDVRIIDHIASLVGKDSMAIKLHPRNEINRFENKGYKTNKSYGIPWELVAANLSDNDNRVFLSFSSGAVLNYKFITSKSFKTILLYKCIGDKYYKVDDSVKQWFEKFKLYFGDSIYIPETENELDELIVRLGDTFT